MVAKKKASGGGSLGQLANVVAQAGLQLKSREEATAPDITKPLKIDIPETATPQTEARCNDEELFAGAMADVERVSWRHDPCPLSKPDPVPDDDPDLEARRLMQEAMGKLRPWPSWTIPNI